MLVLLGFIIVIAAVLGGFTMAGGHIGALLHASEVITIGGAALGALIVMCPAKVLKDLCRDVLQAFKGTPFTRAAYEDMIKMMYEFCRLARRLRASSGPTACSSQSSTCARTPRLRQRSG